ncbi:hypothetical protein MKX01_022165, partial [Papaver californicum]
NSSPIHVKYELSSGGSNGLVEVNVSVEGPSVVVDILKQTQPLVAAETTSSLESL